MGRVMRPLVLVFLVAGIVALSPVPATAAETANSEIVIIREEDMVNDDLYVSAVRVLVEGRIDGDLIAFAAEEVVITGSVTGSVLAVSPQVIVDGAVDGSLRAVAGSVDVDGRVGGDVVVGGLDVNLGSGSTVVGEVLAWAVSMQALGTTGSLSGSQRSLELGGTVESDVDVSVGVLRVVEPLDVGGDFGFRSNDEAGGLDRATVGGVIVDKTPLPPNLRVRALRLLARSLAILFLTIAALTVTWGWPERVVSAMGTVRRRPVRIWAHGALVVFSPLILTGVAASILALAPPEAGFPLLAMFIPAVVVASSAVAVLGLVAGVPVVGWLGSSMFPGLSLHGATLAGSLIIGALWLLPYVGWLVPLIVLPLGLGAWLRHWLAESEVVGGPGTAGETAGV